MSATPIKHHFQALHPNYQLTPPNSLTSTIPRDMQSINPISFHFCAPPQVLNAFLTQVQYTFNHLISPLPCIHPIILVLSLCQSSLARTGTNPIFCIFHIRTHIAEYGNKDTQTQCMIIGFPLNSWSGTSNETLMLPSNFILFLWFIHSATVLLHD